MKKQKVKDTKINVKEANKIIKALRLNYWPKYSKSKGDSGAGTPYYTWEDLKLLLSKEEFKKFGKWISGQTAMIVENDANGKPIKDPVVGYYSWDVDRFYLTLYGHHVMWD